MRYILLNIYDIIEVNIENKLQILKRITRGEYKTQQ